MPRPNIVTITISISIGAARKAGRVIHHGRAEGIDAVQAESDEKYLTGMGVGRKMEKGGAQDNEGELQQVCHSLGCLADAQGERSNAKPTPKVPARLKANR
jgi:hypothetical protein